MGTLWPKRVVLVVALGWLVCRTAAGGPLEELKAASGLGEVDAHRVKQGEVLTARGTQGSFSRGVYAESGYFLQAAPDVVKVTLLHWDPSKYKETEVSTYRTYQWPAGPDVFRAFRLDGRKMEDHPLLDWTVAVGTGGSADELHLQKAEAEEFRKVFAGHDLAKGREKEALASEAWQTLLRRHSDAVGTGGLAALPTYRAGGLTINAAAEVRSLLKMTPAIAKRFYELTVAKPLTTDGAGGAGGADESVPYAEESLVHGHTSLCLGASAAHQGQAGSWQVLDLTYYTADTYFVSCSLYQLWPWEGGTLVWQIDYASAPFRGYLGGIDKVFAGKEMTKDSTGAVGTLRKELMITRLAREHD